MLGHVLHLLFSISPACISLLCIKCSNMHWRGAGDAALRAVTPEHQGTVCSPVAPSHRFFHHLALPGRGIQVLLKHKTCFAWWPKVHGSRRLLSNLCNFYTCFPWANLKWSSSHAWCGSKRREQHPSLCYLSAFPLREDECDFKSLHVKEIESQSTTSLLDYQKIGAIMLALQRTLGWNHISAEMVQQFLLSQAVFSLQLIPRFVPPVALGGSCG